MGEQGDGSEGSRSTVEVSLYVFHAKAHVVCAGTVAVQRGGFEPCMGGSKSMRVCMVLCVGRGVNMHV